MVIVASPLHRRKPQRAAMAGVMLTDPRRGSGYIEPPDRAVDHHGGTFEP